MKQVIAVLLLTILAGCAGVQSKRIDGKGEGLVYFLPKQDFIVTVTSKDGKAETVVFSKSAPYPDLGQQFVATGRTPFLTKNVVTIEVSKDGLLNNASKSSITSQLQNVLDALGSAAASVTTKAKAVDADVESLPCSEGSNVYVFAPDRKAFKICGVTISVEKIGKKLSKEVSYADDTEAKKGQDGLYYRRLEPYLVSARGENNKDAVLMSPSQSPTYFAPFAHSFFAPNDTTVTFADGIAAKYERTSESEVLGLLKLPASVITAYFTAVGSMFDMFKSTDQKDASAIQQRIDLELAKRKLEDCRAALAANDPTKVQAACGNK